MSLVTLHDKQFKPYISAESIHERVSQIAGNLTADLKDSFPLFLVVLNGSFIFAADLVKMLKFPCEISFVKLASYHGTGSTGVVNEIIGLTENVEHRTIVIIEDIVDTGTTFSKTTRFIKG